jgi:hypothetical protein
MTSMRLIFALAALVLGSVSVGVAAAAGTHPFDVRHLISFDRLSEPSVSPDGRSVAFTVSSHRPGL